jgi:hypothetical protein
MFAGYHANTSRLSCINRTSTLLYLSVRLGLMTAVFVSSIGRIEVATDASFEGIVRSASAGLSLFRAGSATEGPTMRAVWMPPRKNSVAP